MSNVSASTRAQNAPNYLGKLILTGNNQTPFLNIALGNGIRTVGAFTFPLNTNYALEAASAAGISEETAAAAGTATTYVKAQDTNVCQIKKYDVQVTYKKLSEIAKMSGVNINDPREMDRMVADELAFQIEGALAQARLDMEKACFAGSYVAESAYGTAQCTRGIEEAISTNAVNASSAALDEDMINEAVETAWENGATFENMVCFPNSFQLKKLNAIYKNDPMSRTEGGRNIQLISTPHGAIRVIPAYQATTSVLSFVDMRYIQLAFCPVPGQPEIFFEEKSFSGAVRGGIVYVQWGLDYSLEKKHAKIYGLATA